MLEGMGESVRDCLGITHEKIIGYVLLVASC